MTRLRKHVEGGALRVGFAADQRKVDEVADANEKGNKPKGGSRPGVRLVFDAGYGSQSRDVAESSTNQQDGALARTRCVRYRLFKRNRYAASDGGHALIGFQFLHAKVGVHRRHGY